MMSLFFLGAGIFLVGWMVLTLVRLIFGPSGLDRIMAGNIIGTKTTALLLLIGLLYDHVDMFVDIAIAYALLNFIATLGAAKYFLRRKSVHE
jgi:multicomponent Na+:H+ antiporter subunit F